MPKMFFEGDNCRGATSGVTGITYNADKHGFISVDNAADVKNLKSGGYIEAGGLPHCSKYWECECGWQSHINSCPKCNRTDLTKVQE